MVIGFFIVFVIQNIDVIIFIINFNGDIGQLFLDVFINKFVK